MHRGWSGLTCGLGVLLVALVALSAQDSGGSAEGKKLKNQAASSPESIAAGGALFAKNCRFCHNADAKGNGPMAPKDSHPPDLTDAKWDHGSTDGEIFLVLQDGAGANSVMKPYKGRLSEADMWNVVNFLRSLGPKK